MSCHDPHLLSDFPGGQGESQFSGRGSVADVSTQEGRRALGFEKLEKSDADEVLGLM